MKPLLECIPNFSEGRNPETIAALAQAIESVPGVALLHQDVSAGANRTVMTFAGQPEAVIEAAYRALKTAAQRIDMRRQAGVHPRIGATDVCPFVPLAGIEVSEAVALVDALAERVGKELHIPVFLYEENATQLHRKTLPQIRRGEYEGLAEKIKDPRWKPDYGPQTFNAATGATVLGVRKLLVAFNISLKGIGLEAVREMAVRLRETGASGRQLQEGEAPRGLLPAVRVIGWYQPDYDTAQLSMNLLDYHITPPLTAFLAAEALTREYGGEIIGSELIGLMPEACLLEAGRYFISGNKGEISGNKGEISGNKGGFSLQEAGIRQLKLDGQRPFLPDAQILEYRLREAGLLDSPFDGIEA